MVDVWDRQWLSLKMSKTAPHQSALFVVNVRLTDITMQQLLTDCTLNPEMKAEDKQVMTTGSFGFQD